MRSQRRFAMLSDEAKVVAPAAGGGGAEVVFTAASSRPARCCSVAGRPWLLRYKNRVVKVRFISRSCVYGVVSVCFWSQNVSACER